MISAQGWLVFGLVWVSIGAAVGWRLYRAASPPETAAMALVCWPLLLPLLAQPVDPLQSQIAAEIARLRALSRDMAVPVEVAALQRAMAGAVDNLHRLDALIAELDALPALAAEREQLLAHRARTEAALQAVLAGAVRLRVRASMAAMPPDALGDDLRALQAGLESLEELAALTGSTLLAEAAR